MPKFIDLAGQTFNRLTVLKRAKNDKRKRTLWKCKCICGETVIIRGTHLISGATKSCGCLKNEKIKVLNLTHGMTKTPEYRCWRHIMIRCYNPSCATFKDYGGRGITVCDEWRHDFMAFYDHVGNRPSQQHSIDRIRNNGNYEPDNTRWTLPVTQANNRKSNHLITLYGWTLTISNWSRFVGLKQETIRYRIKHGWPLSKAIFQPVKHHKKLPVLVNNHSQFGGISIGITD